MIRSGRDDGLMRGHVRELWNSNSVVIVIM